MPKGRYRQRGPTGKAQKSVRQIKKNIRKSKRKRKK